MNLKRLSLFLIISVGGYLLFTLALYLSFWPIACNLWGDGCNITEIFIVFVPYVGTFYVIVQPLFSAWLVLMLGAFEHLKEGN